VWRVAAAELDGYRRAYGLDDPEPAKHRFARVDRDGRSAAAATRLAAEAADGPRRPDSQAAASAPSRRRPRAAAASTAPWAVWNGWPLGAGRREQHMGQHPNPDPDKDEDDLDGGVGRALPPRHWPVGPCPDR
jgi:hypothetical protein